MSRKSKDRLPIGLAVFCGLAIPSLPYLVERPRPLIGLSASAVSPSLFPMMALGGLLFCALLNILRNDPVQPKKTERLNAPVTLVASLLVLVGLMFDQAGFVLSVGLAALVLSWRLGNRNPMSLITVSVLFPAALFWLLTSAFMRLSDAMPVRRTHLPD